VLLAWAFVPIIFFAMFREGIVDPDLWWHLEAGRWMLRHGRVPSQEFYSYTSAGHEWIAHEWLTEIVFWMLYRLGGMWGLVALQGVMTAAILVLYYFLLLGICRNAGAAAAGAWLVGIACYPFLRVRPHLFTFFLLGIVFALAFFYTQGFRRVVWLFPPLMVLWVNLHGGYVVGLAAGLALLVYEVGRVLLRRDVAPREAAGRARTLAAAGTLGILAVLLNPHGARMWIYPFEYLGESPYTQGISEWRAPDFASGEFFGFEIMLLVGFVTLAVSQRRPHLLALAACLVLLHQSLTVLRYIPIFALCFGPVLVWHLSALPMPRALRPARRAPSANGFVVGSAGARGSRESVLLNVTALAMLPVLLWSVARSGLAEPAVSEKAYPREALAQLDTLGLRGNLFHDYKWGGYLLFHAYPDRRVFIDGRADAYKPGLLSEYLTVSRLKPGWDEILDRHAVRHILWPAEHALTEALKVDPRWELRHTDPVAVVFSRRAVR